MGTRRVRGEPPTSRIPTHTHLLRLFLLGNLLFGLGVDHLTGGFLGGFPVQLGVLPISR